MSTYHWYHKAQAQVKKFLPDLDPDLEVEVEETEITLNDGGKDYKTFSLVFSHVSNPNLRWTMEIQENDGFIDNELESVIRRIYFARVE
ncbi:MAG: hypothetical protein O2909_12090 [Chloroflexi bacterium]|nr:hypothetical protein [Chloroflexota bacterium]MDA1220160.1 hypothetical protein [Chloroflexota bacterium]